MARRYTIRIVLLLVASLPAACQQPDPYSARRIRLRWAAFNNTAESIERHEVNGKRRVHEDLDTLQEWWRQDCKRYQKIIPTVGDYIW